MAMAMAMACRATFAAAVVLGAVALSAPAWGRVGIDVRSVSVGPAEGAAERPRRGLSDGEDDRAAPRDGDDGDETVVRRYVMTVSTTMDPNTGEQVSQEVLSMEPLDAQQQQQQQEAAQMHEDALSAAVDAAAASVRRLVPDRALLAFGVDPADTEAVVLAGAAGVCCACVAVMCATIAWARMSAPARAARAAQAAADARKQQQQRATPSSPAKAVGRRQKAAEGLKSRSAAAGRTADN
eukprot:m51a1_g6929 hypothetical protein (239) ;mRNA; r:181843-183180